MSKKRTSAETNDDEQQNEDSDSLLQQGNNAKHAKLDSLSDTTLKDLPMELIEFILIKVVAMEVKDMKLAKSVWKEKADLVINRLTTVCSYWSSILTTNFFRNELHRTLDTTDQQKIRLEVLHQSQIPFNVFEVTTMKDDMFMICAEANIIVYNRNNMERLKDVIAPQEAVLFDIAGCNVSNCVYVLGLNQDANGYSILRITKDEDHQFSMSPWKNGSMILSNLPSISVSANGSLIILSWRKKENPAEASIYDANGLLQHKIILTGIHGFRLWNNALLKSNGNLVLVSLDRHINAELSEIDTTGRIERKYKISPANVHSGIYFADRSGRFVITEWGNGIRLLDSELNLLDFTGPQLTADMLHYSSERNEVVSILSVGNDSSVLTIFRFIEE